MSNDKPRVSHILDSIEKFRFKFFLPEEKRQEYLEYGEHVHKAIAYVLQGKLKAFDFSDNESKILNRSLDFLKEIGIDTEKDKLEIERYLECDEYIGTIDIGAKNIVVDWKTGNLPARNSGLMGRYIWQIKLYMRMYRKNFGLDSCQGWLFFVDENKKYGPIKQEINDESKILSMLNYHNYFYKTWEIKNV